MTGLDPHGDALGDFTRWAGDTELPAAERRLRTEKLALLLGREADLPRGRRYRHADGGTTRAPAPPEPLPDALARAIEREVRRRHAPARFDGDGDGGAAGDALYVMPQWLCARPAAKSPAPARALRSASPFRAGLRVSLRGAGPAVTVHADGGDGECADPAVSPALRVIALKRKTPSKRRRRRLVATAKMLLDALETVLGAAPSAESAWLLHMLREPRVAEQEGLAVWNGFVAACNVTPSFHVSTKRTLSLATLILLRRGADGGRHREVFAEHHPWSLQAVLDSPNPEEPPSRIDSNPANALIEAAKHYCCRGDAACDKAIGIAKMLPRHRHNVALDALLGSAGRDGVDNQIRSILLEVLKRDSEILTHIGSETDLARQQIMRAIEVVFAYRDGTKGSLTCAYELAVVLARMMIRNGCDPDDVDPEEVATGLVSVSADTLAVFAAASLSDASVTPPHPDADTLDTGVLAFLAHVCAKGPGRPRLSTRQLIKFTSAARYRCVHTLSLARAELDRFWMLPPGWSAREHAALAGARIEPLYSLDSMTALGHALRNCLREGRYQLAAALGRLALFSIEAGDGRAALALKPVERDSDFEVVLDGWKIDQLRGPQNLDPSPGCTAAAEALVRELDGRCPLVIPYEEIARRERLQEVMNRSRSFNEDADIAAERWSEVYLRHLPRGFRKTSPAAIVDRYFQEASDAA